MSKLHVLSLLSLALDSRRLDRLARQRRADVSLLASPRTRAGATVEISWQRSRGQLAWSWASASPFPPSLKDYRTGEKLNNGYNQSRLGLTYKQSHHTVIHSKQLNSCRHLIAKKQ